MARPARVRMRARKPWLRLRRRLLGWNVRLLIWDYSLSFEVDTARGAGQGEVVTKMATAQRYVGNTLLAKPGGDNRATKQIT